MKNTLCIAICGLAALLAACDPKDKHGYIEGDCVQMKIDGRQGTYIRSFKDSLRVRFAMDSARTNTSLFGSDGDIKHSPYSVIWVKSFEVEPCNK